jgi:hypothetical protein
MADSSPQGHAGSVRPPFRRIHGCTRSREQAAQQGQLFGISLPNEVIARARFLFGPEIRTLLLELHELCPEIEAKDNFAVSNIDPWFKRFLKAVNPYKNMGDLRS